MLGTSLRGSPWGRSKSLMPDLSRKIQEMGKKGMCPEARGWLSLPVLRARRLWWALGMPKPAEHLGSRRPCASAEGHPLLKQRALPRPATVPACMPGHPLPWKPVLPSQWHGVQETQCQEGDRASAKLSHPSRGGSSACLSYSWGSWVLFVHFLHVCMCMCVLCPSKRGCAPCNSG